MNFCTFIFLNEKVENNSKNGIERKKKKGGKGGRKGRGKNEQRGEEERGEKNGFLLYQIYLRRDQAYISLPNSLLSLLLSSFLLTSLSLPLSPLSSPSLSSHFPSHLPISSVTYFPQHAGTCIASRPSSNAA